ncbi:Spt20 family-domain-containing protein [Mycena vitilis]|nr:Spt20 family-domain-containing protein [Mycena vitilis]
MHGASIWGLIHSQDLLEKNASHPPSFAVHLHPEHWTLNNVSTKFLYNTQISCLLDDIRAHRIPVDFLDLFDAVKVPFYEGCMIVELLDYRRSKETAPDKPERTRVVLHPNGETLFADICSLNRKNGSKWSDRDALAVEARLLLATATPLCLAPDPHLTRVANHVLRVSTPTVPISLKRKAAAMDPEEDEIEKARRTKIMQFMTPRPGRTHAQKYVSPINLYDSANAIAATGYSRPYSERDSPENPNRLRPLRRSSP